MASPNVPYERQTSDNPNPIARFAHRRRYGRSADLADALLPKGGRIVDFGAGTGRFLLMLHEIRPDAELIAIEPFMAKSPDPVIIYKAMLSEVEKADIVSCFEVIEHLIGNEVEEFLADACNVIKPEGRVIISVPIMVGPVLPIKVLSGMILRRALPEYGPWQLVRGTLGLSVSRVTGSRHSHRGFDFRELRRKITTIYDIADEFYSPFPSLPWIFNSQAFFVCTPKK